MADFKIPPECRDQIVLFPEKLDACGHQATLRRAPVPDSWITESRMRMVLATGCVQSETTHRTADKTYRASISPPSVVALPRQPFLQTQKAGIKNLSTLLRGGLGENRA